MPLCNDITKERDIRFTLSLTKTDQAKTAAQLLLDVADIESAVHKYPNVLRVRYDVRKITLQMLESALIDVGFTMHHNLVKRFERGVIAYCEDALRSSLGVDPEQQQKSNFRLNKPANHNLDPRPDNWRNYV